MSRLPRETYLDSWRRISAGVSQGTPSSAQHLGSLLFGVPPPTIAPTSPSRIHTQLLGISYGGFPTGSPSGCRGTAIVPLSMSSSLFAPNVEVRSSAEPSAGVWLTKVPRTASAKTNSRSRAIPSGASARTSKASISSFGVMHDLPGHRRAASEAAPGSRWRQPSPPRSGREEYRGPRGHSRERSGS